MALRGIVLMEIIFISMFLGIVLGMSKYLSERAITVMSKLTTVSLLVMLVSLGALIGSDAQLLRKLDVLGAKSLVIALFSIVLSVGTLQLLLKLFKQGGSFK